MQFDGFLTIFYCFALNKKSSKKCRNRKKNRLKPTTYELFLKIADPKGSDLSLTSVLIAVKTYQLCAEGQFSIGLVLGVVLSPCVGPTLGAAVVLASQGSLLPKVALLMGIFGLGAALPVIMLTYVSRGAMLKMRGKLMQAGKTGKTILGAIMMALSLLILTGADRPLEARLVEHSPAWLTRLTTRF